MERTTCVDDGAAVGQIALFLLPRWDAGIQVRRSGVLDDVDRGRRVQPRQHRQDQHLQIGNVDTLPATPTNKVKKQELAKLANDPDVVHFDFRAIKHGGILAGLRAGVGGP